MTFHPMLFPVTNPAHLPLPAPVVQPVSKPKRKRPIYDIIIDRELVPDTWIFVGGRAIDLIDAVRYNGMAVLGEYEGELKSELDSAEYHLEEMEDDIGFYLDMDGRLSWIIEQCTLHTRSVMRSLSFIVTFREANPILTEIK